MRIAPFLPCLLIGTLALGACASEDKEAAESNDAALASVIGSHIDPGTLAQAHGAKVGDPAADFDQDGIPDAFEEQLIRRYRPYYKFSKEGDKVEANRPADPVHILEDSQLKEMQGDNDVSDPISGCGRAGDEHLVPASSLYTCKPDVSYVHSPQVSMYCLNIADADYGGVSADEAKAKSTGFYGHVVKDTIDGHEAYKIEYWQFWGFNNQDITVFGLGSFGDHEGDWTGLELWYDTTTKSIAKMDYLVHGKEILFTMPANVEACGKDCFQTIKGSHYDMNIGSYFDDNEFPKYSENAAEIYYDAQGQDHTVVYIERGGHEFWPGSWGKAEIALGPVTVHNNAHNGEGIGYLVNEVSDRPFNLGELAHPLTPEARIVLEFNGHWGCTNSHDLFGAAPQRRSPVGPAMHCEWRWPDGGKAAPGCEH